MKSLVTLALLTLSLTASANTTSFQEIMDAQEVLTISPVEIDGLPVVGLDATASKVCKTAGFDTVRSFKFDRNLVTNATEAYTYEQNVLKKKKVAGAFAKLTEVVCSK